MKTRHTPVNPSEIVIGAPLNNEAIWQDPSAVRISNSNARDAEFIDIRDSLLENVGVYRLLVAYDDKRTASRLTHRISNGSSIWGPKGLFAGSIRTITSKTNLYYYVYAKAVEPA